MGRVLRWSPIRTPGGRPGHGPVKARWRRGSSPTHHANADVVSFFITGRLVGQADSDAFLNAMTEQLMALGPSGAGSPSLAEARVGTWLNLLAATAAQAEERGRRVRRGPGLDRRRRRSHIGQGTAQHRFFAPPSSSRWRPFHHHEPPRPWPGRQCSSGHPLRTCIPRHL